MRILVVYNSSMESRSVSGVHRYFAEVVPHWIAQGHVVDFLAARSAHELFGRLYPQSRLISSDDLVPAPGRGGAWWCLPGFGWRALPFHYARDAAGYDVHFACAPFLYEVYPAWRLAVRNRGALVVKAHHMVSAQARQPGLFNWLYLRTELMTVRLLHRHADLILSGAPPVAADYQAIERRLGLEPSRVVSTGYGLNLAALQVEEDAPKEFDAVLLGRVHALKGVFDAPEIWKQVVARRPGARLLVIGDGVHRTELQQQFEAAGLGASVRLAGGVSDEEKNRLLSRCRVGLSLSREEGWGLSVTECLAFGLPVVAMHLPIFDHVFPGQLDLVGMGDTAACARRILTWLENPVAARERGRQGRRFVEQYDSRVVADRELAEMEQALARAHQRFAPRKSTP